jgi:glutaredoxin 3
MIKIYSTPSCGYCRMVKEYFKSKGLEFTEIDISINKDARKEMIANSGSMGVPVIEIDGKYIVGFDKSKIDAILDTRVLNLEA